MNREQVTKDKKQSYLLFDILSGGHKTPKEYFMKNTKLSSLRLVGIIALVAVIGFTMIACNKGGGGGKLSGTFEMDDNPGYTRTFSGGKHTFEGPGFKSEGTFTVSGDEVTITAADGDETTFKFKLSGNKLQIVNVKDSQSTIDNPDKWATLAKK
jgi:hypothetical protein